MNQVQGAVEELERDGFAVLRDFFDPALVAKARSEIAEWYRIDEAERRESLSKRPLHAGSAGKTILTDPTHLMLDVYGKSPTLDALFEKILTDDRSASVLTALAGKAIKLRGYNIKKMTGKADPKPTLGPSPLPHEWHRDSRYEICIAIFLDDFSQPDNGTTALMKSSQLFPYDPRWSCLFGPILPMSGIFMPELGVPSFLRFGFFNKRLARRLRSLESGAYGKRGDFYIFINDVWHGREPNIHRHDHMMLMVGAFPSGVAFPDRVTPPDAQTLAKLPPRLRAAAAQETAADEALEQTILGRMYRRRAAERAPVLFRLARAERMVAEILSIPYVLVRLALREARRLARRVVKRQPA